MRLATPAMTEEEETTQSTMTSKRCQQAQVFLFFRQQIRYGSCPDVPEKSLYVSDSSRPWLIDPSPNNLSDEAMAGRH